MLLIYINVQKKTVCTFPLDNLAITWKVLGLSWSTGESELPDETRPLRLPMQFTCTSVVSANEFSVIVLSVLIKECKCVQLDMPSCAAGVSPGHVLYLL